MIATGESAATHEANRAGFPERSERGLCPRTSRGGGSEGGGAPLRPKGRRLGVEYHSIGRKPVYPA